jgi:hypothetical protein
MCHSAVSGIFNNASYAYYDQRFNEIVFNLGGKSIAYNEKISKFTSRYTVAPVAFFGAGKQFAIAGNGEVLEYNTVDIQDYRDQEAGASVAFVVNQEQYMTKVFDTIRAYDDNTDTGIKSIVFDTLDQSGSIDDTVFTKRESDIVAALPRDKDGARLRGKYMKATVLFNTGSKPVMSKIPYFKTNFRYSFI